MGGHRVPEQGPNDDGYDEDGYDESQRAEILEVTRDGPTNGLIQTDIAPDLGEDAEAPDEETLDMIEGEVGEEDNDAEMALDDDAEDEVQEDFDNATVSDAALDEQVDDADGDALEP
jgi:hypothetical protein